jgi:hypothetical protein
MVMKRQLHAASSQVCDTAVRLLLVGDRPELMPLLLLLLLLLLLCLLQLHVFFKQLGNAIVDEHADILAPVTSGV